MFHEGCGLWNKEKGRSEAQAHSSSSSRCWWANHLKGSKWTPRCATGIGAGCGFTAPGMSSRRYRQYSGDHVYDRWRLVAPVRFPWEWYEVIFINLILNLLPLYMISEDHVKNTLQYKSKAYMNMTEKTIICRNRNLSILLHWNAFCKRKYCTQMLDRYSHEIFLWFLF